ncbi:flagellar export chaperone FliS [Halanaerobaculum tunisiense]
MANNPYEKYKNTQIETAAQEDLVLMLYKGAIKFINQAKLGLEDNDYETVNNRLNRTQAIVQELMTTLDMEAGGEIAENLEVLYDYMNRRLIEANVNKKAEPMDEVLDMFKELRDTWKEAMKKFKQQKAENKSQSIPKQTDQSSRSAGGISIEG